MRKLLVVVLVALVAPALTGCLSQPSSGPSPGDGDGTDGSAASPAPVNASGARAVGYVESFAMEHPNRYGNTEMHEASRVYLEEELRGFGLEVRRHTADGYANILGIQNGTSRSEEWIVISAHYDSTESTIYGAWDDGAGVAAVLEMARTFSKTEFNRTIVYTFFDGEEQGLQGSQRFVDEFERDPDVNLTANINLDPPGLNYPCVNPDGSYIPTLVFRQEGPDIPFHDDLFNDTTAALDAVGVPEEAQSVRSGVPIAIVGGAGLSGTSDHANFHSAGIANLFLGGIPVTEEEQTSTAVLTYGLHTPVDTIEQMEARCGGMDLLEQAFQTILDTTYETLVRFDQRATPGAK